MLIMDANQRLNVRRRVTTWMAAPWASATMAPSACCVLCSVAFQMFMNWSGVVALSASTGNPSQWIQPTLCCTAAPALSWCMFDHLYRSGYARCISTTSRVLGVQPSGDNKTNCCRKFHVCIE